MLTGDEERLTFLASQKEEINRFYPSPFLLAKNSSENSK
jgi:hypothetical protein